MKLALLGADNATLDVVRAAIIRGDDIVWGCELADFAPAVQQLVPEVRTGDGWEALLTGRVADAVVVARGNNDVYRCEQLVKLAQGGVPLLLVQPLFDGPLPYYEIELAQREGGAVVVPCLPARLQPTVAELRRKLAIEMTDPAQQPQQIVLERRLPHDTSQSARERFAHDADLLRFLCGPLAELAAFGPEADDPATRELNLQLKSAAGTPVRWSCETSVEPPGGVLMAQGSSGSMVLCMPDDGSWSLDANEPDVSSQRPVAAVLDELERGLDGQQPRAELADAIEAMTLVEAVDRSVRRSRTIQLRTNRESERETFQATMSAWGCLLLGLLTFAAPVVALLVWLGASWAGYIPHIAAGVLVVFLATQLLVWIIPRDG